MNKNRKEIEFDQKKERKELEKHSDPKEPNAFFLMVINVPCTTTISQNRVFIKKSYDPHDIHISLTINVVLELHKKENSFTHMLHLSDHQFTNPQYIPSSIELIF